MTRLGDRPNMTREMVPDLMHSKTIETVQKRAGRIDSLL